ncbi:MAG TPA: PSD1 and planctomycete cytochrome C domain-containing protein [Gemmataceae bacterium]|nr:PSD1 and planctomycete cytochrome C domain-containing protein [Gemmataceae bacterium]
MRLAAFPASVGMVLCLLSSGLAADVPDSHGAEFFEKSVRPVLAEHCVACHGPEKQRGGLRLDSKAALMKGADVGPVIVAGDPDKSKLVHAVRQDGEHKMPPPPRPQLAPEAVEALTTWVKMGAPWPDGAAVAVKGTSVDDARKRHWSFQPVHKPALPTVKNTAWVKNPIDAFVLAQLEEKGLAPSRPADRRTLIRRVSLDLIGLPPTPEEVEALVSDPSPDAYEKLVDRLLASPHYGERWGRHWLDIARYSDTKGYVFTEERRYPYSYTYRDYAIRAFNDDLPYDQFIVQQLAADRLPLGDDKRPLAALGYLTLGRRFLNNQPDIIDDRIDVTMRGFQALTVGCARCHDHKFDPIPTRDYYSLYGVFASSTEPKDLPAIGPSDDPSQAAAFNAELKKRQDAVADFKEKNKAELAARNRKFRDDLRKLENEVTKWEAEGSGGPVRAMALEDLPNPVTPHVFLRGKPDNVGPEVPRQFVEVLSPAEREPFKDGSGRLELARAIASKDNPLTARVMVNRIWQHHFGEGIVRTPSDFGARGEPPTHPELLDWLAATFMEGGWSIKKMHRLLLLSNTYQQESLADPDQAAKDPENRLLSHMNRLRLEYEPLRDSLLFAAGDLDPRAGGKGDDMTNPRPPFSHRRTVYGFIDRQNLPGVLRTFDFASPDATVGMRHATTTPPQALFLMNNAFVVEQAKAFAARPDVAALKDDARIDRMVRIAYGRPAEPEEIALGLRFLKEAGASTDRLTPWEQYAQVLLEANEFAFVD